MKGRPGTSVRPGRFRLHGFEVEVEPTAVGEWRARVVSERTAGVWQTGRHAWGAMDAAVLAHLAAKPGNEVYVRLLEPGAREAEPHSAPLVAA